MKISARFIKTTQGRGCKACLIVSLVLCLMTQSLWAANPNCQIEIKSLAEIRQLYPIFSANSQEFLNYCNPLFKCPKLHNFQVIPEFSAVKLGFKLPADVKKLLKSSEKIISYIGAYPPLP